MGVVTTFLFVLPAQTLLTPAMTPKRETLSGWRHPPAQAPPPPTARLMDTQGNAKQREATPPSSRGLACDPHVSPAVLASGFWTEPGFGLAAAPAWHLEGPEH